MVIWIDKSDVFYAISLTGPVTVFIDRNITTDIETMVIISITDIMTVITVATITIKAPDTIGGVIVDQLLRATPRSGRAVTMSTNIGSVEPDLIHALINVAIVRMLKTPISRETVRTCAHRGNSLRKVSELADAEKPKNLIGPREVVHVPTGKDGKQRGDKLCEVTGMVEASGPRSRVGPCRVPDIQGYEIGAWGIAFIPSCNAQCGCATGNCANFQRNSGPLSDALVWQQISLISSRRLPSMAACGSDSGGTFHCTRTK